MNLADTLSIMLNSLTSLRKRIPAQADPESGFSLVEIIIALGIVAILAAILIPNGINQVATAKREEVRQDVIKSASNIASWQLTQDGYKPIPTNTEFNNKLKVQTSTETTITMVVSGGQICVQGSRNINGAFTASYSLTTNTVEERACQFIVEDEEDYG